MKRIWLGLGFLLMAIPAWAGNLDTIGVTLLRTVDPALQGAGVQLAHPEPSLSINQPIFEVRPSAVGQPASLFTYTSSAGSATNFPNAVGSESSHANGVGANFYGLSTGVAPQAAHVDNYNADFFYNDIVNSNAVISARIINQSFIFPGLTADQQRTVDAEFDNYAAQHGVLFVSGGGNGPGNGNGGFINAPATCYNGIGVGVVDGSSSIGPTRDNGRSKPDITAPGGNPDAIPPDGASSFSAPYVAGAAAVLRQAGLRGDGGIGTTNDTVDIRTIKALLLNGAIKPANWTNGSATPLDARYGAGIVNVFNSYQQLKAGKHAFIESTVGAAGGPPAPGTSTNNTSSLVGWDFATMTTLPVEDRINHYYFNLSESQTLTATLVWNRQNTQPLLPQPSLNNLDLFLLDATSSNVIASSTSGVDNVEHLFRLALPPGRYDLQVVKRGSVNQQSTAETYALAFEIFSLRLQIVQSTNNVIISWPISPTGFVLQSTTNLNSPILWTNVNASFVVTNLENRMTIPASGGNQFYRLKRP